MSSRSDPRWIEELLGQARWVRRIAGELVIGDLADDLSQEALALSLRHPPQDRATPRAWLRTVVANLVRSGFRRDRRRELRERLAEGAAVTADSPEELAARMELQRLLAEQILALGEPYRETIILRYIEGLSSAAIARSLRLPSGTVRRRLKVGLDRLRKALDERHGGRREGWSWILLPLAPAAAAPGGEMPPRARLETARPMGGGRVLSMAGGTAAAVALVCGGLWLRAERLSPETPPAAQHTGPSLARARAFPGQTRTRRTTATAAARAAIAAGHDGRTPDPRLESAALAGTVRAADGSPVAGAIVTLTSLVRQRPHATATTAADGGYAFAAVPAGHFAVTAAAPDRAGWASHGPIALDPEVTTRADLVLAGGAVALAGRVLDAGGAGSGVSRATVTAWTAGHPWMTEPVFEVAADDAGNYLMVLPPGRYLLQAQAAGYSRVDSYLDLPGPRRYHLRLHPSALLAGRVVEGPGGDPVAGALVTAVDSAGRPRTTTTDEAGAFALAIDSGPHHVWSRSDALFGASRRLVGVPAETTTVEIQVRRMPAVAGRILTSRGQPAAAVTVSARPARDAPSFRGMRFRTSAPENRFHVATTDAAGRFGFEGLPACALELSVESPDHPPVVARLPEAEGAQQRWIDLRLVEGARLRGVVVGAAAGEPAAPARVSARVVGQAPPPASGAGQAAPAQFANVLTDERGRFELRGLPAGDVWLAVEGQDGSFAVATVERLGAAEARHLTVPLEPASRLSGWVRFPDGQPAPGVLVEAVTERHGIRFGFNASGLSGEDGRFSLPAVAAGTVSLELRRSWYGSSSSGLMEPRTLVFAPGEHLTDLILVVPRQSPPITGMVTDREGRPVTGAAVDHWLENPQGRAAEFLSRTFTDESGAFELSHVPAGTHRVVAHHPAFGKSRAARVAPGTGRLMLQLSARGPGW